MSPMKRAIPIVLVLLATCQVFACQACYAGYSLKDILYRADVIVLVRILENKRITTQRKQSDGSEFDINSNHIKSEIISLHRGSLTSTEPYLSYSFVVVERSGESQYSSGVESGLVASDTAVLLFENTSDGCQLFRVEKGEKLHEVLKLKQSVDDEDARILKAQATLPNGIYPYSQAEDAQKVVLQDRRRREAGPHMAIGLRTDVGTVLASITLRLRIHLLCLNFGTTKLGYSVLIVNGKAYWISDHHWAAGTASGQEEGVTKRFHEFTDRAEAEAVAAILGITVIDDEFPSLKAAANE